LLDRRLNPPPPDQTEFAAGLQQYQHLNVESLSVENSDQDITFQDPVEHSYMIDPLPAQQHSAPNSALQEDETLQRICPFCDLTFDMGHKLKYAGPNDLHLYSVAKIDRL